MANSDIIEFGDLGTFKLPLKSNDVPNETPFRAQEYIEKPVVLLSP